MHGLGAEFLRHSFDILIKQTYKDFDIIISDNSIDTNIEEVCKKYTDRISIHYYKNEDTLKRMGSNINNALQKSTGDIIKILFLDDFLRDENSLKEIAENFDLEKDSWLVTGCEHTINGTSFYKPHYPKYNNKIYLGKNTIGSPSVLTIKNKNPLLFDNSLRWLIDCDYYKRCYNSFGKPKILDKINVVIRTGEHQITNTEATETLKYRELLYIVRKYSKGYTRFKLLIESFVQHQIDTIKIWIKSNFQM